MKAINTSLVTIGIFFVLSSACTTRAASSDIGGEYETEILDPVHSQQPALRSISSQPPLKYTIDQAGLVSDEFADLYASFPKRPKTKHLEPKKDSKPELASLMVFGIGMIGLAGLARKRLRSEEM